MADEPNPDLIERAAKAICDAYEAYPRLLVRLRSQAANIARALADAGLLADPEQHAERLDRALWLWAEEKWRREQLLAQRGQWWETVAQQRREVEAERDLALWLHAEAKHNLREDQQATFALFTRVHQALGVSITAPWHGLAEAAQNVVAERDNLVAVRDELARQRDDHRAERDALQAPFEEPCDECRRLSRRCEKFHGQVRTVESERDGLKARHDKLSSAVRDVLESLKGSPCSFWACPGPDEPFTPMATCNVCAPQIELRAALQGDQPTEPEAPSVWTCERCGGHRWLGWRAGPAHEGYPRFAQCVPCAHVQTLPVGADRG